MNGFWQLSFDLGSLDPGRAELFIDAAMNYSRWARVLANGRAEPHTAPLRPVANEDGRYIPLVIETNRERVSRSGVFYPAKHLDWGRLEMGREPADGYDPHAEWTATDDGRSFEIAIPWGLLNVGDPSSRAVLDDKSGTSDVETTATSGIGLLAWATKPMTFRADSLGPARAGSPGRLTARDVQFLGPVGTTQDVVGEEVRITSPETRSYLWNGWEMPMISERVKRSVRFIRQSFEGMDAREQRNQTRL